MMPLTPNAQIDERRRLLRESEQHRQTAKIKLADHQRQLGTVHQTIAAQDHRIGWLTAEVALLYGVAATLALSDSVPKRPPQRSLSACGNRQ